MPRCVAPLFLRRILPATAGACVTFLFFRRRLGLRAPRRAGRARAGSRRREITAIGVARTCAIAARSLARNPRRKTRENPRAN